MGNKFSKFKGWFFTGRIEKKLLKERRIEELSKEYNEGEILIIGHGSNN